VVTPPLPQPFCLAASEVGNHRLSLSFRDNMSSWSWRRRSCAQAFDSLAPGNSRGWRRGMAEKGQPLCLEQAPDGSGSLGTVFSQGLRGAQGASASRDAQSFRLGRPPTGGRRQRASRR
jgi:hypothetical protein